MAKLTDEELLEVALANQIPEAVGDSIPDDGGHDVNEQSQPTVAAQQINAVEEPKPKNEAAQYLGQKLGHMPGQSPFKDDDDDKTLADRKGLSKIGENISVNNEIRDGWIDVDNALLGARADFYPEDWKFRIRPATVEAIRNWSTIDDENPNSVDDVFNEVLKSCLTIVTDRGRLPWGHIHSWDRLFFILLIREYTFVQGENKLSYEDYCPECDNPVTFELTSQSLMYEFPDADVMRYFDRAEQTWYIDPQEFGIENANTVELYIPTLERDAAIKQWMISRVQENRNYKFDTAFLRFAPWLVRKLSKDDTIARRQMKEIEMKFKSWDIDLFSFMDEVLRNITVTPSTKLIMECPTCGEEVTSEIRFPNSIRDIFSLQNRHRKFGAK